MFQVDQKRGEELKGVKVKRKQPSYWGAIEELLRSCKNCCGIISEWVSETNYKIGEATLGSPFVHVFLRSENPSLGIRDTLKRWSSLLNTRLCIPRVSGSSPPQFHQHNNVHHCNFYMFQVLTGEWGNFLIKFQPSAQTDRCWAAADSCFDSRKQTWKISCQLWVDLRAKRKESAYDAKS